MYAIIEVGSRQYRVAEGDVIDVDRRDADEGSEVVFDQVKLVEGEDGVRVGTPAVAGASVAAQVVGEVKGPKVRGCSFRRRKGSKVKYGHRQRYTRVKITGITAG